MSPKECEGCAKDHNDYYAVLFDKMRSGDLQFYESEERKRNGYCMAYMERRCRSPMVEGNMCSKSHGEDYWKANDPMNLNPNKVDIFDCNPKPPRSPGGESNGDLYQHRSIEAIITPDDRYDK